jgi:hypothetical protein
MSAWSEFVEAWHAEHGDWPTISDVEAGLGLPVTPVRITGGRPPRAS